MEYISHILAVCPSVNVLAIHAKVCRRLNYIVLISKNVLIFRRKLICDESQQTIITNDYNDGFINYLAPKQRIGNSPAVRTFNEARNLNKKWITCYSVSIKNFLIPPFHEL